MYSKAINTFVFVAIAAYPMGIQCRVNLAYGKKAQKSPHIPDAHLALDNVTTFTEDYSYCSRATRGYYKWWSVDLGQPYDIGKIEIYGKPLSHESTGLRVFVSLEIDSHMWFDRNVDYPELVYTVANRMNDNNRDSHYVINLTSQRIGQYITITKVSTTYPLVLCEVIVYESCQDYQFEPNCETCNCAQTPCNKSTGICSPRCKPGWTGDSCNIYELK